MPAGGIWPELGLDLRIAVGWHVCTPERHDDGILSYESVQQTVHRLLRSHCAQVYIPLFCTKQTPFVFSALPFRHFPLRFSLKVTAYHILCSLQIESAGREILPRGLWLFDVHLSQISMQKFSINCGLWRYTFSSPKIYKHKLSTHLSQSRIPLPVYS